MNDLARNYDGAEDEVTTDADRIYKEMVERKETYEAALLKPPPFQPIYWRVLVQIDRPQEVTDSGIMVLTQTLEDEMYLKYVGKVVAIGSLAFQAETRAGLKLCEETHLPKIGDYAVFYKNSGNRFETHDGRQYVLISDSEIWGVTETPDELDCLAI